MDGITAWLKAFHIAAMLIWCASLFYLPGLLAAHVQPRSQTAFHRLRAMTRIVFLGIASPAAIIAIVTGTVLIEVASAHGGWLALKLTAVGLMAAFHVYCGALVRAFRVPPLARSAASLYALVGVPGLLVPVVFWLVLGKPV
jgi:protoporphyrinogen IX oxidase